MRNSIRYLLLLAVCFGVSSQTQAQEFKPPLIVQVPPSGTVLVTSGEVKMGKDFGIPNISPATCTAESVGATALDPLSDDLIDELSPVMEVIDLSVDGEKSKLKKFTSVNISPQALPEGWLTGYDRGLGLHYIPKDKSLDTQYLLAGTIHGIIPHADKASYFVFSENSDNQARYSLRQCVARTDVSIVTETSPGVFDIRPSGTLPPNLGGIKNMANGDLFLTFFGGCRMGSMPTELPDDKKSPPIGFKPSGQIYAVCDTQP